MDKRIPFILGFVLLAIALWLQVTSIYPVKHFILRLENLVYDLQLRANLLTHPHKWQSSVAIVDIDDKSLRKEGRWPWPRAKMAELMDHLQTAGAVVVAFDILFPEKQNNVADDVLSALQKEKLITPQIDSLLKNLIPTFDDDAKFAASLARMDVVLGTSFLPRPQEQGLLPPPLLELKTASAKQLGFITAPGYIGNIPLLQHAAKNGGFINVFPDDDGIVRRVPILIRYQDNLYPSLALEAVRLYLLNHIQLISANYNNQPRLEAIKVGDHIIPTDAAAKVIIPFRGKSFTFSYFSATDILNNQFAPGILSGKIIFVGTSATGLGDLKATAVQSIFPGVEIQASIADGILTDNFSYKPAWAYGAETSLTIFLGLILIFLFPHLGPRFLIFFGIGIPLLLIFSNSFLWQKTGLIISIFIPISFCITLALLDLIYGYLFETRKREKLKEIFGQYVPEKHIDEMLEKSSEFSLYGEDRELTVLFADIRNFTALSEPLNAAQLKEMLNAFFTPMTEIIFKFRGTIDKYVGDMIMAFWGAPLKDKRHAKHAIRAALHMQKAVEKLNSEFAKKGWAEISIGIGLNTGIMSIGDMGSKFRRNYTVLGDSVNLASRVESLTKYYDVKIIVTEFTRTHQKIFIFRKLDRVRVKGKTSSIDIYEPLDYIKTFPLEAGKELKIYHAALEYYFSKAWEKALALFTELKQKNPEVKLYSIYMIRIEEFMKNPPPEDWDGVYVHVEK